jgi:hypothetical protein
MSAPATTTAQPWLNAIGSRYFLDWLLQQRCSLAFTTYQTGKLFLVGRKSASGAGVPTGEADQALSVFERTYNHCMGMFASPDGRTIWLSRKLPQKSISRVVQDGEGILIAISPSPAPFGTWHWRQLERSGCEQRISTRPATPPWHDKQFSRMKRRCGITGGAPG